MSIHSSHQWPARAVLGMLLPLMMLSSACVRHDDFTVMSSKNVLLNIDKGQTHGRHKGTDSTMVWFLIPTGIPSMAMATEEALEEGKGNLLVDAKVYYATYWYLPFIMGRKTMTVEGEVFQANEPLRYAPAPGSTSVDVRTQQGGR